MNKKIGFIGLGRMSSSIISGILEAKFIANENIYATEINAETKDVAQKKLPINIVNSNKELVESSDIIILCTKPFVAKEVIAELAPFMTKEKTFVSIAAGISTTTIESILGEEISVVRVMPNTPALLKVGMSCIAKGKCATDDTADFILKLFSNVGKAVKVDEKYIDIVTALSGSGPAFYYYIIDEMAKSAKKLGLEYETAVLLSAQTALGAATMLLDSQQTPAALIKAVTTPGGCTEVGNKILENSPLNILLDEVIEKTAQKAHELG